LHILTNRKVGRFWVVDYRIYEREKDGKSKLEHVADMLKDLLILNSYLLPECLWIAGRPVKS